VGFQTSIKEIHMSTIQNKSGIQNKLIGVAFSAAILAGAVALADPSVSPVRAATTLAAGSEGSAVIALMNSDDDTVVQPVQVAYTQTSYAGQSALLRAPSAPHPQR
jgi:hypothetical protein